MENTDTVPGNLEFLGTQFQFKLLTELIFNNTSPETKKFTDRVIKDLQPRYFTSESYKQIATEIKNYWEKFSTFPNCDNLEQIVNTSYYTDVQKQKIHEVIKRSKKHKSSILDGRVNNDSEHIQTMAFNFIKQQKHLKVLAEYERYVKSGRLDDIEKVTPLLEDALRFDIAFDEGIDLFDNSEDILSDDYKNPVRTGIKELDLVINGGPGAGDTCIILAPTGIGKSTMLTVMANNAMLDGKNVAHIIFEDHPKDIKRKHYAKMTGIPLSEMKMRKDEIKAKISEIETTSNIGKLIVMKFIEGEATMNDIEYWFVEYQKRTGIIFNIIFLDYLDCVEPNKSAENKLDGELMVMKSFIAFNAKHQIPGWSALQGNRSAIDQKIVTTAQMGGNIARGQKAHLLISIGKEMEQKRRSEANIAILKSRLGGDGMVFERSYFNNDSMEIELRKPIDSEEYEKKHGDTFNEFTIADARKILEANDF